ncbi:MAG: hypothetical protein LBE48_05345, partial [Methanomassiliicoccaceae archaeon]|nr:hypothetical protein [Methanomassiliicoccaceae archaeon]
EHDDHLYVDELPFVIGSIVDNTAVDFVMYPCFRIFPDPFMANGKILLSYDSVIDEPLTGPKKLVVGTTVALTASPASDHTFSYWTRDIGAGENNPYTCTPSDNMTVGAVFAYTGGIEGTDHFTVTYDETTKDGTVMWSITGAPGEWWPFRAGESFAKTFPAGIHVHLAAAADPGHELMVWTGDVPATSLNPYIYTGTASISVGAIFDIDGTEGVDYFVLTVETVTNGNIQWSTDGVTYNDFPDIAGVFMKRFPMSSAGVYLKAVGDEGYELSFWTGGIGAGEDNPYIYTGKDSIIIGAVFAHTGGLRDLHYFVVTYETSKNGTVMWSLTGDEGDWWAFPSSKADINVFEKTFPNDLTVHIKAFANDGYEFIRWTGDVNSEDNPYVYADSLSITISAELGKVKGGEGISIGFILFLLLILVLVSLVILWSGVMRKVEGSITYNESGLKGVAIGYTIDGKSKKAITNDNGRYVIRAPAGSEVVISDVAKEGYKTTDTLPSRFILTESRQGVNFNMTEE